MFTSFFGLPLRILARIKSVEKTLTIESAWENSLIGEKTNMKKISFIYIMPQDKSPNEIKTINNPIQRVLESLFSYARASASIDL